MGQLACSLVIPKLAHSTIDKITQPWAGSLCYKLKILVDFQFLILGRFAQLYL